MKNTSPTHSPRPLPAIGVQLYTVRDYTGREDFRTTLSKLTEMGFAGVEFAWKYGGMDPLQLADFLQAKGLLCCGLHAQIDELLQPKHSVYGIAAATGAPYITTSLCGREEQWDDLLPQIRQAGRIAADQGLRFTYHNHWQEFNAEPDAGAYDRLVEETTGSDVELEIDLGWVHKAGRDAMALWRRLGRRTPQIHLRDYDRNTEQVCDIGNGFIDPESVWRQAMELGTDWLIYEQDNYPVSPFESCRACIKRMNAARPAR